MRTTLLLFVSLLFGFLVPSVYGRQSNYFRAFMKIKANGGVDTTHDLTMDLPDFKAVLIPQEGSKESDKILQLPGQPRDAIINHYGGYITVNNTAGRALYFYFVEAETNKETKPLIVWMNGGPGCSSVGFGAFEELGPFLVRKQNLVKNPYSWHKLGNMLFFDSPAGVGYSYSNTTSDYTDTGDIRTIKEAYTFLINWLERFPEYKKRDVYIAGESYAGHYVPELAYTVLQQNSKGGTIINLKAIAIGNPSIHDIDDRGYGRTTGGRGIYEFLWRHNIMSDEYWNTMKKSCDFSVHPDNRTFECQQAMIYNYMMAEDNADLYNIYGQKCYKDNTTVTSGPVKDQEPCPHNLLNAFFNRPEVVKAFHAKVTRFDEGYPWHNEDGTVKMLGKWDKWEYCREALLQTWKDSPVSILPFLQHLKSHGIPILVYSGDLDGIVPYTSTRDAINRLQLTVRKKWSLWGYNEISGSIIKYQGNMTVATVKGAGHEAPKDQPRRSFELIQFFIEGKTVPIAKSGMDLASMGINEVDDDSGF